MTATSPPHLPRAAAWSAIAAAAAYLATGAFFFLDPSRNEEPGTTAYWEVLADGPVGRKLFVAAFACTGLFALGALPAVADHLRAPRGGAVRWALVLATLGYAVNTVSYVRVLAGESTRAESFADGDAAVREAIESFSLVLDTDGWLTFGGVGVFFVVANVDALRHRRWPTRLSYVGIASGVASFVAMSGLVVDNDALLSVAAGVGGVVLAPVWWLGVGRLLLGEPGPLPAEQGADVEEGRRLTE